MAASTLTAVYGSFVLSGFPVEWRPRADSDGVVAGDYVDIGGTIWTVTRVFNDTWYLSSEGGETSAYDAAGIDALIAAGFVFDRTPAPVSISLIISGSGTVSVSGGDAAALVDYWSSTRTVRVALS